MPAQPPSAPRQRNPRGSGAQLRDEFVAAAARLLASMDRPETLTLRQVAREVGVAPASIYGHFPDLGALVQHVLRQRFEELEATMTAAAEGADGSLEDLVARCLAYAHWGVEHPGEYRTIIGGGMPHELGPLAEQGAGEALLSTIVRPLAELRAQTGAIGDGEGAWRDGLLLWTALHGLVSLHNEHGQVDWPPLDMLIEQTLTLHTGLPQAAIRGARRLR